jgi:hypothetical protein
MGVVNSKTALSRLGALREVKIVRSLGIWL